MKSVEAVMIIQEVSDHWPECATYVAYEENVSSQAAALTLLNWNCGVWC